MTTPAELFAFYVAQRRAYSIAGFKREILPAFTRYTPSLPDRDGIITFATLSAAEADEAVAGQIAYFADLGQPFEWKVHTLDQPADLAGRLRRHGFAAGETEAFMLYPLAEHHGVRQPPGVKIKPIQSESEIRALVALQESIWGEPLGWLATTLQTSLERLEIYGAYDNDKLLGTGWIEYPPHSSIADLHGGAVRPDYRGRGIYNALFDVRAASAQVRGVEWLAVDAAPMSRPILLRQGFRFVCETTPFRLPAPH